MTDYLSQVNHYYESRLQSQKRNKKAFCKGCEKPKTFEDKPGYLVYSCGSSSGNCGPQTSIQLAKYIYYPSAMIDTDKIIQQTYDKDIFQELLPKDVLDDQQTLLQLNKDLKKSTVKSYKQLNQTREKSKNIQTMHRNRVKLKQKQIELLAKINTSETQDTADLLEDYIQINQQLQKDYMELSRNVKDESLFIQVKEGVVKQLR